MKPLFAVSAALALTGCATAPLQPQVVTKLVTIPVAVHCVPDPAPVEPAYADNDAAIRAAPDLFSRAKLYAIGRLQRIGFTGEVVAALKACTG